MVQIFLPTIKFNFPALWLVEIFGHFFAQIFLNINMKLLYALTFAEKNHNNQPANLDHPSSSLNNCNQSFQQRAKIRK